MLIEIMGLVELYAYVSYDLLLFACFANDSSRKVNTRTFAEVLVDQRCKLGSGPERQL
jgi:hypothetical protein